ncbi:MAG: radical SAM protein [Elusimicrobiota bacterium]
MKKVLTLYEKCVENKMEALLYEQYFKNNGYIKAQNLKEADIILIFTCGFKKLRENKWIRIINYVNKKKKEGSEMIICGCLPGINKERIQSVFDGITVKPYEVEPIRDRFRLKGELNSIKPVIFQDKKQKKKLPGRDYAFNLYYNQICNQKACIIKAGVGCLGNCSYCAIKIAKPVLTSTPIGIITDSFNMGLEKGYNNFILSADDLGSYGQDIGTTYVELISGLISIKGDYKIEIRYLEPQWLIRYIIELEKLLKNSNKISFIGIPIQSGSNRILKLMNRDYDIKECIQNVNRLSKTVPSAFIRTHFLVGFPGETEEDFKQTLKLVKILKFDVGQSFIYTDRFSTRASAMDNKVPVNVKQKRSEILTRKMENKTRIRSFIKYHRYRYCKLYR